MSSRRVRDSYLHLHGLVFETSIYSWQDQPGNDLFYRSLPCPNLLAPAFPLLILPCSKPTLACHRFDCPGDWRHAARGPLSIFSAFAAAVVFRSIDLSMVGQAIELWPPVRGRRLRAGFRFWPLRVRRFSLDRSRDSAPSYRTCTRNTVGGSIGLLIDRAIVIQATASSTSSFGRGRL